MTRPIVISIAPNTEKDDAHLALRQLLRLHRHRRQDPTRHRAVEQRLQQAVSQPHVILTSSGRSAITRTLQAAGVGRGDDVITQAFTCLVVPNAIRAAGARPVYADSNPATYNLDPSALARVITPRTKALIIQHTFGLAAPMSDILRLAHQHKLFVIEDCAHALGGTYDGRPLGSFGDAAILSFGRDKMISSIFGGAVAVRSSALANTLRRAEEKLPLPPRRWVIQQLLHPIVSWYIILPLYFRNSLGKINLVLLQKLGIISRAVSAEERQGHPPDVMRWRFSPALLPLLELQLQKLPRFTAHRRQITARYTSAFPAALPVDRIRPPQALLRFPLRLTNRNTMLRDAKAHHLLLGDWYASPVVPAAIAAVTGYIDGSCPNAEAIASEIINLPTYPRLTVQQAEEVITFVKTYAGQQDLAGADGHMGANTDHHRRNAAS